MKHLIIPAILGSTLTLSGCGGMGNINLGSISSLIGGSSVEMTAQEKARYSGVSAQSALETSETRLRQAAADNVEFYSPENFVDAKERLEKARKALKGGKDEADIFEYIILANRNLDRADKTKAAVEANLGALITEFEKMERVHAQQFNAKQHKKLREKFSDLIVYIEEGKTEKAVAKRADLITDCRAFRIEATKEMYVGKAQRLLEALKDNDADKHAASSFKLASEAIRRADLYINASPDDADGIEEHGSDALRAVEHAQLISQTVKRLDDAKTPQLESHVLGEENRLAAIGEALSLPDMSDLPFNVRKERIIGSIAKLTQQIAENEEKLAAAQAKVSSLSSAVESSDSKSADRIGQIATLNLEKDSLTRQLAAVSAQLRSEQESKQQLQSRLDTLEAGQKKAQAAAKARAEAQAKAKAAAQAAAKAQAEAEAAKAEAEAAAARAAASEAAAPDAATTEPAAAQ